MIATISLHTQYARMVKPIEQRIPVEMYPENIGNRLRIIREAFGLKPAEMADILDIERTYWSRFENGKRAITNPIAYLLTERFGVTMDYILLGKWDKLPLDVAEKMRKIPSSEAT